MKVHALLVGTRKCGTTWVYENLLSDRRYSVSELVKESGFFAGTSAMDYSEYCKLYDRGIADTIQIEVDTSICYSNESAARIAKYAPDAKIVLIFREPTEYLVSRYVHSCRKGELHDKGIAAALMSNRWLRDELNYQEIVDRFDGDGFRGKVKIMKYENMITDQNFFLKELTSFVSDNQAVVLTPVIGSRVNQSRESTFPLLTIAVTKMAVLFRLLRLHKCVNYAKSIGVLKIIEKETKDTKKSILIDSARTIIEKEYSSSLELWKRIP